MHNRSFPFISMTSVAGTGLAPMSSGYEPDEVLLLHPAISSSILLSFHMYFKLNLYLKTSL